MKTQERMITQLARQLRSALDGRSHDEQLIRKMGLQLTQLQTQLKKVSFPTKLFRHHRPPTFSKRGAGYYLLYELPQTLQLFCPIEKLPKSPADMNTYHFSIIYA